MDQTKLLENTQRLNSNRAYSAKLSWKRKETCELRRQIKEFIDVNFDLVLPTSYNQFKRYSLKSEKYYFINEEYGELVRNYYTLGNFGESVGSLFETDNGMEVFTNAHLFSKNRIDPVWNWKKSKLIRTVYYNFLKTTKIYQEYIPVHITLTLPHKDGLYKGKEFYAKELIEHFNLIRKQSWWKKMVYAGEYGVEITGNKKNGLHIHIHSLAFMKTPYLKLFREKLQRVWYKETGGQQLWVESLYIYKKNDSGHFITEMKDSNKLITYEQADETYTSMPEGKVIVRKKYYIQDEQKAIYKSNITYQEKDKAILELYTKAILETIKYHFKNETIKLDDKNYNIFLINEFLKNTKGKRLYSRFGKFYKEPLLNFNKFDEEDISLNEANTETVINPATMQEIKVEDTQIVLFYPEKLTYTGKLSSRPHTPLNIKKFTFEHYQGKSIKEILKIMIQSKFGNRKKMTG